MRSLPSLLLILAPFFLSPAHTFGTREQDNKGRISGSTSGPHSGDWFIDTRCHCIAQNLTTTTEVAHIYQWEYYNFHTNTTFIMTSPKDFVFQQGWCRTYSPAPHTKHTDQLCFYYKYLIDEEWHYVDYVKFNGQMRGLAPEQNQGYTETPDLEVDEHICPLLCVEFVNIDLDKEHATSRDGRGKQIAYVNMDDMCDGCL